jgi:hypothetical protein
VQLGGAPASFPAVPPLLEELEPPPLPLLLLVPLPLEADVVPKPPLPERPLLLPPPLQPHATTNATPTKCKRRSLIIHLDGDDRTPSLRRSRMKACGGAAQGQGGAT